MPDRRRHRGAHPQDDRLFAADQVPRLRAAVAELSWLLSRGYADVAALQIVGDHHQLAERQRLAVRRCACADDRLAGRRVRRVEVAGREVVVDGFNALVTLEAALSGGVLLRGRDGVLRDLSSVHGSYRTVEETDRALALLTEVLAPAAAARWLFDRPVSNSGRVAARVRALGFPAEVVDRADAAAITSGLVVVSGDGPLLDRATAWADVVGAAVARVPDAWIVGLG